MASIPPTTPEKRPRPAYLDETGDYQQYWMALGHFIEAFAMAEGALFIYLIHSIGIEKMKGKALFGRSRCHDLIAHVRRTWDVAKPESLLHAELDDALSQLKAIDTIRNDVVHNRSHVRDSGERVASNVLRAHTIFHVKERPVSADLLFDLAADCIRITVHLRSIRNHPTLTLEERRNVYQMLREAWRYERVRDPHKKDSSR